jgi:hypothetical protein
LSPEAYGEAFWRDRVKRAEPSAAGGLLAAIRVTRERAGGIAADILNYLLPPQPLFPLLSTGVSPVRGDASESAKVFLGRTAGPRASVDAREDRVEVRFARIPEGDAPPRVLLVPADETSRPLEEAPQWDADEQCWSASFEPPSGEYLIAFVPNEAPEA